MTSVSTSGTPPTATPSQQIQNIREQFVKMEFTAFSVEVSYSVFCLFPPKIFTLFFRFLKKLLTLLASYMKLLPAFILMAIQNFLVHSSLKSTVKQQLLKKFLPKVILVIKFVYILCKIS